MAKDRAGTEIAMLRYETSVADCIIVTSAGKLKVSVRGKLNDIRLTGRNNATILVGKKLN